MRSLKLREENCSAFGRLILQYLKDNPRTNMSQLARDVKLSPAGLSWICLKRSGPNEATARRIALVIGADLTKIARLVYENKLERLATLNGLNHLTKLDGRSVKRPIPIGDAIAGLNAVFHASHYTMRSVPEEEKPTDFQLYKQAYEILRRQFLKSEKLMNGRKPAVADG